MKKEPPYLPCAADASSAPLAPQNAGSPPYLRVRLQLLHRLGRQLLVRCCQLHKVAAGPREGGQELVRVLSPSAVWQGISAQRGRGACT